MDIIAYVRDLLVKILEAIKAFILGAVADDDAEAEA